MLKLICWLLTLVGIEVAAEYVLEKYGRHNNNMFLLAGVAFYILLAAVFAMAIKSVKRLIVLNTMWQSLNVICVTLIGIFVLREKLTLRHALGICCAVSACALMS